MKNLYVAILSFGIQLIYAQNNFTIDQATSGGRKEFAVKSYNFAQWRGTTHDFTYLSDFTSLIMLTEKSGWQPTTITDLERFKLAVRTYGGGDDIEVDNMTYFPYGYSWITDSIMMVEVGGSSFTYWLRYNPFTNKITQVNYYSNEAEYSSASKDHSIVAYTKSNNLFYRSTSGSAEQGITNDVDPGVVNGSGYVHRQEFGIQQGIFISPLNNYIAFYKKDESMVAEYPIVNTASRIATTKNTRYPMAGEKSEEVKLMVYNIKAKSTIAINTTGPAEQYLTSITWDPTEKYVYIGVLNREQNHLQLNKYDAVSGNFVSTLFEEKHPKYVEPLHSLTFLKTKPNQFIYQSERDGYNHLYLYDTNGKLIKQLTKGSWLVTDLIGFDTKEENVYFISNMDDVIGRHLCSVNIKSGKINRITKNPGTHSGKLSADGSLWLDYHTSTAIPNTITVMQTKSGKMAPILTASSPFANINMPKLEMVNLVSADGKTPLYGRIITPPNMNPAKKYPVVVYVYGGPHDQLVEDRWLGGASLFEYYMAQQGFIMFTMDNRGSDFRGMEFENVIHRQLGKNEMADQMKGVEYLKSLAYVDVNKIGVYGWSFGGFMSISLMLNYPDVFKVGVSGGPVCDWKYYEVMYGERYMDTPQENPDGYKSTSVIEQASQLKGKLLVIHGAQDDVVVMQNSLEFIKACIKKGKPVDYFVYPDHQHNVMGKDRVHLNAKIADYFLTYLK